MDNISFRGSKEEKIFFCKLPSSYFPELLDTRFENALRLYFVLSLQPTVRTFEK